MSKSNPRDPRQLELPLTAPAKKPSRQEPPAASPPPSLRVLPGGGARTVEPLDSRDAVVRVLVEAGADLLLRRISPERAEHIERTVNHVLELFDRVDEVPQLLPVLRRELEALEQLMLETRQRRKRRPG